MNAQLDNEVSCISDTLSSCLYEKNGCAGETAEGSSEKIAGAINSVKKVAKHKFKNPMPAEKQIKALKE